MLNFVQRPDAEKYYSHPDSIDIPLHEMLLKNLKEARIYEIDGRIGRLFALTPNTARMIELPFPILFLNLDINFKGTDIHGILAHKSEHGNDLNDWLIRAIYTKKKDNRKEDVGTIAFMLNEHDRDVEDTINKERGGNVCNILRRILMNFNDFLEHPGIKIYERKRTNQTKRAKRGKMPLPNSNVVVVKGELKIYIDSIQPKQGETTDVGTSYEVAGHWRRFRHPRYTNMQGEKIFIHPYIKGIGTPEMKRRKIPLVKIRGRAEAK